MSANRCVTFVCAAAVLASASSGSEIDRTSQAPLAVAGETGGAESLASLSAHAIAVAPEWTGRGPILDPRLSENVATRLDGAIQVARERLQDVPACQALFERFDADGVAELDGTAYHPAGRKQERKHCRGRTFAVTTVGGEDVLVCRKLGRLSDQRAAIVLLHEALHSAGQTEYPSDSAAPDSEAITRLVMESCRLF